MFCIKSYLQTAILMQFDLKVMGSVTFRIPVSKGGGGKCTIRKDNFHHGNVEINFGGPSLFISRGGGLQIIWV